MSVLGMAKRFRKKTTETINSLDDLICSSETSLPLSNSKEEEGNSCGSEAKRKSISQDNLVQYSSDSDADSEDFDIPTREIVDPLERRKDGPNKKLQEAFYKSQQVDRKHKQQQLQDCDDSDDGIREDEIQQFLSLRNDQKSPFSWENKKRDILRNLMRGMEKVDISRASLKKKDMTSGNQRASRRTSLPNTNDEPEHPPPTPSSTRTFTATLLDEEDEEDEDDVEIDTSIYWSRKEMKHFRNAATVEAEQYGFNNNEFPIWDFCHSTMSEETKTNTSKNTVLLQQRSLNAKEVPNTKKTKQKKNRVRVNSRPIQINDVVLKEAQRRKSSVQMAQEDEDEEQHQKKKDERIAGFGGRVQHIGVVQTQATIDTVETDQKETVKQQHEEHARNGREEESRRRAAAIRRQRQKKKKKMKEKAKENKRKRKKQQNRRNK
eukprot:m.40592 g.40592  ORF g.40592 m.40592 type:complete len:435 (-) comp10367_c0_seq2:108-1412(-)